MQGREEPLPVTGSTLEGTIKYGNAVVPNALVIVVRDGQSTDSAQAFATDDGTYKVENCPIGPVKIGVNTDAAKAMTAGRGMSGTDPNAKKGGKKMNTPKVTDIPKKFFDPSSSGLTTETVRGVKQFDIEIPK